MKHSSIKKALIKNGFKPIVLEEKQFDLLVHYKYFVQGNGCSATWFYRVWKEEEGEREEGCDPYVLNDGQKDCMMTDYFPGFFPKTIKSFINYLKGVK